MTAKQRLEAERIARDAAAISAYNAELQAREDERLKSLNVDLSKAIFLGNANIEFNLTDSENDNQPTMYINVGGRRFLIIMQEVD